jgi:hypothetical protein
VELLAGSYQFVEDAARGPACPLPFEADHTDDPIEATVTENPQFIPDKGAQ